MAYIIRIKRTPEKWDMYLSSKNAGEFVSSIMDAERFPDIDSAKVSAVQVLKKVKIESGLLQVLKTGDGSEELNADDAVVENIRQM